jgi:hypothetical protein
MMSDYSEPHSAVESSDLPKLRALIQEGIDLDEEEGGLSLLQHAIDVESQELLNFYTVEVEMTRMLLEAGADPLRPAGNRQMSARQMAVHTGHEAGVEVIDEWIRQHPERWPAQ